MLVLLLLRYFRTSINTDAVLSGVDSLWINTPIHHITD